MQTGANGMQPLQIVAPCLFAVLKSTAAAECHGRHWTLLSFFAFFRRRAQETVELADPISLETPRRTQLGKTVLLAGQDVFGPAVETVESGLKFRFDLSDGLRK